MIREGAFVFYRLLKKYKGSKKRTNDLKPPGAFVLRQPFLKSNGCPKTSNDFKAP